MLHEILLSLSGHPSPLLQSPADFEKQAFDSSSSLLSPSEKALLSSLIRLTELHRKILSLSSAISSSHPSTICRAVSSAVASIHLGKFQDKIVEVERDILKKDAGSVGAGGIVPLSSVVGEFSPWTRRMGWFWELSQFMQPLDTERQDHDERRSTSRLHRSAGAIVINHLREEARTGYPDLAEVALELSHVAENTWLRQLSAWVLYGRLPPLGSDDFLIQKDREELESEMKNFQIKNELAPYFVTASTASSILFIGRSLNHIRERSGMLSNLSLASSASPELNLLPMHLRHLSAISTPIDSISLSRAISAIRLSVSQNLLQRLLPLPKILEILDLLRSFFLLGRGEFAVALVAEADAQLRTRMQASSRQAQRNGPDRLSSVIIKEGELSSTIARTWAALSSLQLDEDAVDDELDLARDLIRLGLPKSPVAKSPRPNGGSGVGETLSTVTFEDLLFSTPTALSLNVASPLDLFLTEEVLQMYSSINAYLISIRRAHLRLTDLWKHTYLRRDHPAPLGPPYSNTVSGQDTVQLKRTRANVRARVVRKAWATTGAAVFLLGELGGYFQGEVVSGSWNHFRAWVESPLSNSSTTLEPPAQSTGFQPTSRTANNRKDLYTDRNPSASPRESTAHHQPATAPSSNTTHDPETLSNAHQAHLLSLYYFLLLGDQDFTFRLHSFLEHVEHFMACICRLETTWQTLDLQSDEGVEDAFMDYEREERRATRDLETIRSTIQDGIGGVVDRLKELDSERAGAGRNINTTVESGGFTPWKPAGVDRLLMKLDFGTFIGNRSADWKENDEDESQE
ncbi:MAG: hypothetical protein M1837_006995 [Sclerophora amabilis]|nr:MAG: hypothetical protein M1837_006995 [Sclerophora amabilis]